MSARLWAVLAIKVDYDAGKARRLSLSELVQRAERARVVIEQIHERRSASGRGWHRIVWVFVPGPVVVSAALVVALQSIFGSDPRREAFNFNRARTIDARVCAPHWRDMESWNVLYESPHPWRVVSAKLLTVHRERAGRAPGAQART